MASDGKWVHLSVVKMWSHWLLYFSPNNMLLRMHTPQNILSFNPMKPGEDWLYSYIDENMFPDYTFHQGKLIKFNLVFLIVA